MAFRTIIIDKANKINLDLNNLIVLYDNESFRICLDEISTILIEDPRCLVSLKLLTELCEKGINLVLNNSSHMPVGCLCTLNNNVRSSKRYKMQILWNKDTKEYLWTRIVIQKIMLQKETLIRLDKLNKISVIEKYIETIEKNDITNREGLASRIYFKELFGDNFKRFNEDLINFILNYAYQIIRSKISQQIVSYGYQPSLGINHCSEYNAFNLADDFIEVYRPIIDYYIYLIINETSDNYLTPCIKNKIVNIVNNRIGYNGFEQKIHQSIDLYIQNMFNFLNTGDIEKIKFPYLL